MDSPHNSASFGQRMRDIVFRRQQQRQRRRDTSKTENADVATPLRRGLNKDSNRRPANVMVVNTLEEYKQHVAEVKDKIVVVRFYATWCKACKAIGPSFYRLANTYPEISFVEVPVTQHNANLHQGLGVSSLPFGHIYIPDVGLAEELRISRKHFPRFENALQSYVYGSCDLPDGESTNPY
jgi:thiol-disulfide isomerase/thioredoxin